MRSWCWAARWSHLMLMLVREGDVCLPKKAVALKGVVVPVSLLPARGQQCSRALLRKPQLSDRAMRAEVW